MRKSGRKKRAKKNRQHKMSARNMQQAMVKKPPADHDRGGFRPKWERDA